MLILALETSGSLASVALGEGPAMLAESLLPVRAVRSESVLPEIGRILEACGRDAAGLEAVVVGAGPGSFTGVRIAAALAKGLCAARDLPLYAYSSLTAIAAGSGASGPVCAMTDARRGEVYYAAYGPGGPLDVLRPPAAAGVEEALESLGAVDGWTFAGGGADAHAAAIRRAGGRVLPPHLGVPRASSLLWLARTAPEAGRVRERAAWEPAYVRRPSAERQAAG